MGPITRQRRRPRADLVALAISPLPAEPHVREPLEDAGDLPAVRKLADAVLERGTGAARQRAVFRRTGDLRAVVAAAAVR